MNETSPNEEHDRPDSDRIPNQINQKQTKLSLRKIRLYRLNS